MTPQLAKVWVKALRSENRRQTTGTLRGVVDNSRKRNVNGYCCLGVLCSIAKRLPQFRKHTSVLEKALKGETNLGFRIGKKKARTIFGISHKQEYKFIDMNDELRKNFSQIADEVEKKYLKTGKRKVK